MPEAPAMNDIRRPKILSFAVVASRSHITTK